MPNLPSNRLAQFVSPTSQADLIARSQHGTFASHAEAEAEARKIADAPDQDAVILETEAGFTVVGVDEIHSLLPGGSFNGELRREAPIVSFISTDPLSGEETVIGRQSSGAESNTGPAAKLPATALDRYIAKNPKQMGKVLGPEHQAKIAELNDLIRAVEQTGIKVSIELDDDVFENKDKIAGFQNLLDYTLQNNEALQQRSIREIAIVDEWDGVFGTKVELEYDKDKGNRRLEIGDDFLDDWGDGLVDKSISKLEKNLGKSLSETELTQRSESFQGIRQNLTRSFDRINQLQQQSLGQNPPELKALVSELESSLASLEKELLPKAKSQIKNYSVKQERQVSEKYLKTFEDTLAELKRQIKQLEGAQNLEPLERNARLEKLKIVLLKGAESLPDQRNYLGGYVGGLGNGAPPSSGLEYARTLGKDRSTTASLRAGSSGMVKTQGVNKSDLMLGLGVSHTFHSRQAGLDGLNVGIGVGHSRQSPFFVGVNASNSWYLNNYHGLKDQGSVVAGLDASIGTYSNLGAHVNVEKQLSQRIDFEGSGELSLWNRGAEAELEFQLGKNKDLYLTGGIGTNKLVYAGLGFNDKYEAEIGLGGISFGKDSNNLPGESGWEVGISLIPLPLPYYRHNRVPGYQFTYADKSTEYITPNGSFMTTKENSEGNKQRTVYVPDPKSSKDPNTIVYRQIQSREQLDNLEQAPKREISIGPLGYLTVTENGQALIKDGLIQSPLTEADLGIITDQAGVLWFDRMHPESQHHSLGTRRQELPLPLYRAIHH